MAKKRVGGKTAPDDVRQLRPDQANRRRHTARNIGMIVDALQTVGAARSIVIDEHGEVLAGNGVVEAAAEAGITKLQVVDTDGATLIAVRRRGLTQEQRRSLALYDNRAAELAEWNADQLADDAANGLALKPFFDDNELKRILQHGRTHDAKITEVEVSDVGDRFWIVVRGPLQAQAAALQKLRAVMKDVAGVDVELGTSAPVEEWGTR
jgi:ParB-like chromosome segregation protein Spo0J